MLETALLVTALMFGGTVLYSFGFAAFVFTSLPAETAGPLIRRAFPHFYLFVIATSAIAALLLSSIDPVSASIMAVIAATTVPTRQALMPAVNAATDQGAKRRFQLLHSLSVVITLLHILAAGYVLVRLV
ncbi:MAG: DUF4149 domain-containing protein [Pseudomonadota bacterium]